MKKCSQSESESTSVEELLNKNLQQLSGSSQPAQLHFNIGNLYLKQKRFASAIKHYREALSLQPEMVEAHQQLFTLFTKRGREGLATNHQFKIFHLQPQNYSAQEHLELGQKLQSQQKYGRAIACYNNAVKLQSDLWPAYSSWVKVLIQQQELEKAEKIYRKGIKQNRQNFLYYYGLATLLATQKKWNRACKNYQAAAQLNPTAEIFYHWGIAQFALKKYAKAQSSFQQAAELSPTAETFYRWGLVSLKLADQVSAKSRFQQAVALNSDHSESYYQLGLIWQQEQQHSEALIAFQQVVRINPHNESALINLGAVYRQLEKYDLSLACYQGAIKIIPSKSALERTIFEEYQLTLKEYSQASDKQYYQLGRLLRARGYFAQAISAYCESIRLEPRETHQKAYFELQYTPIEQSQLTDLIDFYRQTVAEHPQTALAWGNLGDVLSKQGDVSEALNCYRQASYQQAIRMYPSLAELDWQPKKTSGPDFIIAGASKSGTSSIHFYMGRHPQILLPHKKEIDFFHANYQKGMEWYLAHFPSITDQDDFLTGEATPNYIRFNKVAQRIKEHFPKTKIIVLLRNPVDRSISWHYHKSNTGLTTTSLATEITQEIRQLDNMSETEITAKGFARPDNILGSLYYFQLKFWIETLGREQLLILKSEDFYDSPQSTMETVYSWLGLPNCTLNKYPKVNPGSYQQVDPSLRKTLAEYLAPHNCRLEEYLGMEFNWK